MKAINDNRIATQSNPARNLWLAGSGMSLPIILLNLSGIVSGLGLIHSGLRAMGSLRFDFLRSDALYSDMGPIGSPRGKCFD